MPHRDLVVIGASAGGVEALKGLVRGLPPDLPATVLVALHLPSDGQTVMADILRRRCRLLVKDAVDGDPLEPGTVVVAQPDAHLMVVDGRIALGRGAKENGHRPSHDAMLRSAALSHGSRAVGVILTGLLDDGAAGLRLVHRYGGACLVQSPDDAEFPSMPQHALSAVPTARQFPIAELSEEVVRVVHGDSVPPVPEVSEEVRALDLVELRSALGEPPIHPDGTPLGTPSTYGCPDCHGVLNEVHDGGTVRFRCRTGHAWTAESLLAQQGVQVEDALWTALRILEERVQMSNQLAHVAESQGRAWSGEMFRKRAAEADGSAEALRTLLLQQVEQVSVASGDASGP
ncbi:MAG: chemotaxis protein CheB [Streptomyces sp.]|uniref:chemotaxis protein CheB n=1 Tax=Streptomyces sp. TaxID=1931 RepID=UPI0025F32581|nr:chemotaxis protein CheB [Streptomyces sp.]MBW8801464.1 chemotaxis protein CheB [Streptomyces sp.]